MEKLKQNVVDDQLTISRCITESSNSVRESSNSIPIDLLIEIFSRVPPKSIGRFRCVSKFWASILRRPDFTELFLSKSLTRPRFFFAIKVNEELVVFSAPQPQNIDENSSLVATRYKSFPKYFPTEIRSPLCGLVFLHGWRSSARVICNPITGESITLPRLKANGIKRSYFGFDPINKQFKVLCITWSPGRPNTHWVLTLETRKRLWRRIQDTIFSYFPLDGEICINGVLYCTANYDQPRRIVCFDVRSEKIGFVNIRKDMSYVDTLFNYKGKLGAHRSAIWGKELVLWVLEDAGKHKWSKIIHVLPPSCGDTFCNNKIAGIACTGEIVFARNLYYLFYYNVERNTLTTVVIKGFEEFKDRFIFGRTFLGYVENMKFM